MASRMTDVEALLCAPDLRQLASGARRLCQLSYWLAADAGAMGAGKVVVDGVVGEGGVDVSVRWLQPANAKPASASTAMRVLSDVSMGSPVLSRT